jgi:hypothetical protein
MSAFDDADGPLTFAQLMPGRKNPNDPGLEAGPNEQPSVNARHQEPLC